MKSLTIRGHAVKLPIYLPDATRAVVKSLDTQDLYNAGVEGIVVNTLHLAENPGLDALKNIGGVKGFMDFNGLVTSDSGGWQVFSLIHRNKTPGKITDDGVTFTVGTKKKIFTPEQSIQTQVGIGSDIVICLDDFTPPDATNEKIMASVERTILWAKRSKTEFERLLAKTKKEDRPTLLAVIQGGWSYEARKYCAEKLVEIGFDAYGFGGYIIDAETKKMDLQISKYIAELIPDDKLKFALGVGNPYEIAMCAQMGWQIFDCTLPTRDARHKRLYVFNFQPKAIDDLVNKDIYGYVYINKAKYKTDMGPIEEDCDCHTCKTYSKAYLHHLFEIKDTSAYRLATIHNLRFYTRLINKLRGEW